MGIEILDWFGSTPAPGMQAKWTVLDEGQPRLKDAESVLGYRPDAIQTAEQAAPGTKVVIAIGDPEDRARCWEAALLAGLEPCMLVHQTATVAQSSVLGDGAIIGPFSYIGPLATIESNALVNVHSTVGHDGFLGHSSVLSPYAAILGKARCGSHSLLASRATILPGKELGSFSKLDAGTVMRSDAPDGSLVSGEPARHRVIFTAPAQPAGKRKVSGAN